MKEMKIYVGLNDSETMKQEYETERYIKVLEQVCKNYHVAFSFNLAKGGYFHEDGRYTQETSLILSLIDPEEHAVNEIARDLCVFFHQESVLITEDNVRAYYVNGMIDEK